MLRHVDLDRYFQSSVGRNNPICALLKPYLYKIREHIHSMHLDKFACPRCTRRFDSESGLQSHHEEMMAFGGLLCPVFSQDISLSIHEELSKMRRGYHMWGYHRRRTAEEEWQIIYQLLFPNDGRTLSPCKLVSKRHSSPEIYSKS